MGCVLSQFFFFFFVLGFVLGKFLFWAGGGGWVFFLTFFLEPEKGFRV